MTAPMTCCGRWAGPSVQQGVTRGPLPTRAYHVHACSSQERRSACVHVAPAPRRRVEVSAAGWADVRETHIGVVFLLGERAFKMKKPVTTGFLDFATPQQRLAACRREVELNRRLAPDVYLGVSSVSPPELPPYRSGDGDALAGRWAANVDQVRALERVPTPPGLLAPELVDASDRLATRFLTGRG